MLQSASRFLLVLRIQFFVCLVVSSTIAFSTESSSSKLRRFYLDVAVEDEAIGRLVFCLPSPNDGNNGDNTLFPNLIDNLLKLVSQERRSIDPQCHYVGCQFNYSPQFIQTLPQYRWAHVLPGRNRNAVGRPTERIAADTSAMQKHQHAVYGGIYYGLHYPTLAMQTLPALYNNNNIAGKTALLTLPMTGPGRGSTELRIVRVAESPREWGERLLLNTAVVGWVEPASMPVLQQMAQQRQAPPVVTDSGILASSEE